MSTFHSFVPEKSIALLQCWVAELEVEVNISKPRKLMFAPVVLVCAEEHRTMSLKN